MVAFPIEVIRHSAAHVLAQAVLELFPEAKLGIGPSIEDGFYYDFELPRSLSDDDLIDLERRMNVILVQDQPFSQLEWTAEEAVAYMTEKRQSYKLDIIKDLNLPTYSFFKNGPFLDLCKGPHVASTGQIGVIKLLKVSGAYWRGSEKNPMLQRIYGTAFCAREDLDRHLLKLEEAKKRDHRLLGKDLGLFSIQEDIGGGLILWHPKGARMRYLMEEYWRQVHLRSGYEFVNSPHVGLSKLWHTSGHLDFYQENMYSSIRVEEQEYYLKPMNCPFHIMVYKDKGYSYRHLPLRFAELGTVYRYERSGVLHGLMRVRGFTQDDAHIICTPEQVQDEILTVMKLCLDVLSVFGFQKVEVYLSTRPKEKFVGDLEQWAQAENALRQAIDILGIDYQVDDGGGAFYGPKIDIKIEDAIGRQWQCSTVQFDFNLPDRFDMTYIGVDGKKHRPYMIHRALWGSVERFFGILIEHYEGKFPAWLAPVQVRLLTVSETAESYALFLKKSWMAHGIRVELDHSNDKIGAKIRKIFLDKIPYHIVLGDREIQSKMICVKQGNKEVGSFGIEEARDFFLSESAYPDFLDVASPH